MWPYSQLPDTRSWILSTHQAMRTTQPIKVRLLAAALLCFAGRAPGADEYWSSASNGIQVTTYEGAGYTTSLARDLARFDKVLARILQLTDRHLPTRV